MILDEEKKRHYDIMFAALRFTELTQNGVNATCSFDNAQLDFISVGATLVCALMKGNPTLHLRKSKSTSPQEIPFSSCKKTDIQRVRGEDKDRQTDWRQSG